MNSVFVRSDHTEIREPKNMLLSVRGKIIINRRFGEVSTGKGAFLNLLLSGCNEGGVVKFRNQRLWMKNGGIYSRSRIRLDMT